MTDVDLAIVGSGFGGSLLAIAARRLGLSVALLERGTHPRFAIGESSSPLANVLLERLADDFDLAAIRPLSKWGTWRRERDDLACGLKRGFTFLRHDFGRKFAGAPDHGDQLFVAASPRDEIADTHWYRADFDHFLVRQAQALGVSYHDRVDLNRFAENPGGVDLAGDRRGQTLEVRAKFCFDASGPRGFLSRTLGLGNDGFPRYPATQGLFTHFEGVARLDEVAKAEFAGSPYPADDAALHHVFDGGWIWVLRFSNGITSAGCAVTDALAKELDLPSGEPAWNRLLGRLPTVAEQFAASRPVLPWTHSPGLPFRVDRPAGPRWALLPSAAAFVDPLLSTGIPMTLLGIERMARAIREHWGTERFSETVAVEAHRSLAEADAAADLVAALYASFGDFEVFADLTMLYFAAASFSEAARRLGKADLADSFLLHENRAFGPELRRICRAARDADERSHPERRDALAQSVRSAIHPLNIAGLCDPSRRNWYPVLAEDLLGSAGKLGASRGEAAAMLRKTGFA